jgi:cysteine desulfurase/selenocysteine lyase
VNFQPELGSRALFPSLAPSIYANHAAIGPLPTPAIEAMARCAQQQATHGISAMAGFFEGLSHTRALASRLLGGASDKIALTSSTSASISAVAASIPWKAGDRIVLFEGEFPANTTPWQLAAKRHDLDVVWLPVALFKTDEGIQRLQAVLEQGQVRLIAVSAVQFNTGLRMPIEDMARLAHDHGAEIFVDAIQAVGAVPFDGTHLDYIAVGGQKWLMGPPGAGLLYVRDWSGLTPVLAGWLSHEDPLGFLWGDPGLLQYDRPLQTGPALLEGGTLNFAGLAGLTASMGLIDALGVDRVFAHANLWLDRIEPILIGHGFESMRAADPAKRSTILCCRPPNSVHAGDLVMALAEHGISLSSPDGALRFSPSWPNAIDEVAQIEAILPGVLHKLNRPAATHTTHP